jgi:hypothetical protein
MTRLLRIATALYPARWRARYGREFDALIEDMDPDWRNFWDVVNGGLVMRLTSIGPIAAAMAIAGILLGGAVAVKKRELYRSSATVTLKASDPQRVRAMLGSTFGPGSHPGAGMQEKAAWIRVAVDERGPAQKDGATRLVVASEDEDAARAQRVTQQLVDLVAKTAAAQAASSFQFDMLSPPNLPTSPSGPSRVTLVVSSVLTGFLLAAIAAWFRQRGARTTAF